MKTSTENYLWGILLPLAVPIAECFLILGEVRSGFPQSRNGDCCANRRLHHMHAHTTALEVPARKLTRLSPVLDNKENTLAYGASLITSFRLHKATARLLATTEVGDLRGEWDRLEIEQEGRERGQEGQEQREGLSTGTSGVRGRAPGDGADGEVLEQGEGDGVLEGVDFKGEEIGLMEEEGEADKEKDEIEPKAEYVLEGKSEFDICFSERDFFSDLVPIEEYQPTEYPDNAACSREELMNANLSCAENPFDLTSFYVDRDIKVGVIDEKKREAIQPMMKVVEQVCELIDTTDDVFSFKYTGLIVHKRGIEAWTKQLIKEHYPNVKDVDLVTNRTRDRRDH